MAMVWRATVTVPWDGKNFGQLDAMRKIANEAQQKLADLVGKDLVGYDENLTNTRNGPAPKPAGSLL